MYLFCLFVFVFALKRGLTERPRLTLNRNSFLSLHPPEPTLGMLVFTNTPSLDTGIRENRQSLIILGYVKLF